MEQHHQKHARLTKYAAAPRLEYGIESSRSGDDPTSIMLSRQFAEMRAKTIGHEDTNILPTSYRVSPITLPDNERAGRNMNTPPAMASAAGQQYNATTRPRKQLFIVSFKCSRVDVFYLLENTGLAITEGDIVIVEADRGQDLGTVQHANVTQDEARNYKRRYGEEQYKWLMMFSKNNNQGSVNPNAQVYGDQNRTPQHSGSTYQPTTPQSAQGLPRDNYNNLKPKAIKRLASQHEIRLLGEKEGNEAKAKRTCQNKVATLHLDMEILDAEWQWDFQKLIFYYYADHYINFKDLITELYRIYKTRIWLSAINPASFSQHAMNSPPSGIGPGALTDADRQALYAAGKDPDPYGAIPPYQVGYQTYTPNYPGIPGVANSFAIPMQGEYPMPPQGFQVLDQRPAVNFDSSNPPPGDASRPWQGALANYPAYPFSSMNWQPFNSGSLRGLNQRLRDGRMQTEILPPDYTPYYPPPSQAELFPTYLNGPGYGAQIPEGVGWEFRPGKFRPGSPPRTRKGMRPVKDESQLSKATDSYSDRFSSTQDDDAKAGMMGRFLNSLQEEDTRADEMSRER